MMRRITERGINLIKRFEGFSPAPYVCPAGYPTIGYGHVIRTDESFSNIVSELEAVSLLQGDIRHAEAAVLRLIAVPLTDYQFDALVSFTFNLGAGALQRSTLRRKINSGYINEISEEFMKWVWSGGRKLSGLIVRRKAESDVYMQIIH